MNIITCIKSIVAVTMFMSISGIVLAGGTDNFSNRIAKQTKAVEAAVKAKEINSSELKSLKKEINAIKRLYKKFSADKSISPKEAKTLNSKLNDSDVNLFRKKYD